MGVSPTPAGREDPETAQTVPHQHGSQLLLRRVGLQSRPSPPGTPPAAADLRGGVAPRPLTCFGCIGEFRSTNGAMNRYVPVGKAQLKFVHRPLSSLVQEEGQKEKQKNRTENKWRSEEESAGARETVCVGREAQENKGGTGYAGKAEREDKKKVKCVR